ncbi:MAG: hypothetical protein ACEPO8_14615 [Rhodothermaceae bacterium]
MKKFVVVLLFVVLTVLCYGQNGDINKSKVYLSDKLLEKGYNLTDSIIKTIVNSN